MRNSKDKKNENMNNVSKFSCPNCGTEFEIRTVGKSNMKSRLDALKAAGMDTEGLVAIQLGGTLGETVGRIVDGVISVLSEDDPLYRSIIEQGTIPNRKLFRRWVMAQMFAMLASGKPIHQVVKNFSYKYTWKMLIDELYAQEKLCKNDPDNYKIRNQYFNLVLAMSMAGDYIKQLETYLNSLQVRSDSHGDYVILSSKKWYCDDIESEMMIPLRWAYEGICSSNKRTPLHERVAKFYRLMPKFFQYVRNYPGWIDAYKAMGAYYTLENLIRFHGCKVRINGEFLSRDKSLEYIRQRVDECVDGDGWKLVGLMKEVIEDNHISVLGKMKEWRIKKALQ